jgi:FkbM family methyltransferase
MNTIKQSLISLLKNILPEHIKRALFHLSFNLAQGEFERFAFEYCFAPNMRLGLTATARRGLSPNTVIDVGAFEGNWSKLARSIWPDAKIVMFEPLTSKQDRLASVAEDIHATVFCELLGAQDADDISFNVMESGSSVLSERSPLCRTTELRRLRRLDTLLDGEEINPPALVKIDAQGYELEVLKGADQLLQTVDAILLEIAVIEVNEGAPLLHDVIPFMQSAGFVTYDILEIHRRPLDQAMNQVDILFLRASSPLLKDRRHFA